MKQKQSACTTHPVTVFEVFGRVQGVGFRWAAQQRALELELKGWIRNRADAAVEGVVYGDADAVTEFLHWLADGPVGAVVENVHTQIVEQAPDVSSETFAIRR